MQMILINEIFPLNCTLPIHVKNIAVSYDMYEFRCDLITDRLTSAKHKLINCLHEVNQSHFVLQGVPKKPKTIEITYC